MSDCIICLGLEYEKGMSRDELSVKFYAVGFAAGVTTSTDERAVEPPLCERHRKHVMNVQIAKVPVKRGPQS